MSLEFTERNLKEVYDFSSGLSKSSDEFGFGFPFLSFKTIFNNYYIDKNLDELVNSTETEQKRHSIKKGDVFLTRTSETLNELGMSCVALKDYPKATFNGFTKRLRAKKDNVIYPLYATYYFRSPLFRKYIDSMAVMTTRASLNNDILSKLPIFYPTYENQIKIGNLLHNLSKKIEKNKEINKNLEEFLKQIFFNWFINVNNNDNIDLKFSEIGYIPKNWKVVPLIDLVKVIDNRGKTPPLVENNFKFPIIDVKALSDDNRIVDFNKCTKYVDEETYNTWFRSGHPKKYDILISTVGTIAELKLFLGSKGCLAQNVVAFRSKKNYALYLYQYLTHIKKDLEAYNIGSVQPSIKITHILKHPILIPDDHYLNLFNKLSDNITNLIYNNYLEIEKLIKLRDTLLPKLMSGEIDISKITCDLYKFSTKGDKI